MHGPHMLRFDDGHQFATDGGPNQPEPNRRWWYAAAVVSFCINLALFAALILVYGRF